VKYMNVLTVKETADVLKVKPQWVYRMIRNDGLPCIRLGRRLRIDEDSLLKWLAERRFIVGLRVSPVRVGTGG
jgi:excisionase family DNA binding protein